jgi:Mrp family chromosome partitioning ATPase
MRRRPDLGQVFAQHPRDIISGQFGPKSRDVLEKQAVRLWIASTGITAGEVVAAFRDGELVRFQLKVWMKIAVAGGKGGTGKTLIATALSIALSGSGESVVCMMYLLW